MKKIALLAMLVSFGIFACSGSPEVILGVLTLEDGLSSAIAVDISKSPTDQEWMLKFSPRNYDFETPPDWANTEVEVSVENTSARIVEIRLPEGLVSLAPRAKRVLFAGKFRDLFLLNRSMEGQYAIRTTLQHPVSLLITATPLTHISSSISFEVVAFRFTESL